MNRFLLLARAAGLMLLATSVSLTASAQPQSHPSGTIEGTIVEAESEAPLEGATVALWNAADSSLVTGAITKPDGSFSIDGIRPATYYVQMSFVGYRTQTLSDLTIDQNQRVVNLGRTALAEDTAMLDEVEVTAERSYVEVGIDKTAYNVENQPLTAGGSGLDVLSNIPSIEVDIDDNISLRGSENVAIYLNGRPAPMSGEALSGYLNGLSAESIKRVEIIPNPSARYEPEGMSGIINIVLAQKQTQTLGGSVSANANTNDRYGASGNLHFGSGPWNVFAGYGLRYGQRERSGSQFRENRFLDPMTYLAQEQEGERSGLSHNLNATIDYRLSDLNTLSVSGLVSQRGGDNNTVTTYSELDTAQDLMRRYNRQTDGMRDDFEMEYRLSFKRTIEPSKHELSAEISYEQEDENDERRYTENLLMADGSAAADVLGEQIVDQSEFGREVEAQIDYVRPLGEAFRMEAGYKGALEGLDNSFYSESLDLATNTFQPDIALNNTFTYAEQVHAAYGILAGERGAFGGQLGLRAERAFTTFDLTTTGESFDNTYTSLYPSAHASYSLTEGQTLKLSYSKRVRRPNTWQLNPFGDYDDPTSRRVGNPYLTPEYTHAFELGYSHIANAYTLSLAPYYRHTVDAISWSQRLTDDGVTLTTFENFATEQSYGTEVVGTLNLGRRLRTTGSFNLYQRVTDGSNTETALSSSALGYATRLSATASLPSGTKLQLSQFYRSPMDVPGGHIDAFTRTDLALQKDLLDGRASLSLRASDLFNTMGFNMWRESAQYYQTSSRDFNAQALQISLRYNFGQQDRQQRRRDRGEYDGGGEEAFDGVPMN